ncbi:hypothetical protein BDV95DRAFT_136041 [Massariosphaeria phaeospora]|uniref:RING-type domain-containing protein n=1 Tax=Massariosphaeria phaeospora TaxID=100035 RepID=A0A7C8IP48_9PLEO|nr:hypothetical protein BDV95DRAFT_136041 [Massariosphaeria phaeospora]
MVLRELCSLYSRDDWVKPSQESATSNDVVAQWTSGSRKRAAPTPEPTPAADLPKRSASATCPHTMTAVRSSRRLAEDKKQCPICLDDYFDTPEGRDRVTPVKMPCQHIFCRSCIEMHLSSSITCALPWCETRLPLQPDSCELCRYWEQTHADSLIVTIRATEMSRSIKDTLQQLAQDDDFFALPKRTQGRLLAHVRETLTRYEYQFHYGADLAEILDPFLLAVNVADAREHYGPELYAPAPDPSRFPARENDPDDYPAGQEPWIAAFFRQWALDYEHEYGEAKEGWGMWSRKDGNNADWSWEWPYKRIVAHKTGEDGAIVYLVKWVGKRYAESWIGRELLDEAGREEYDRVKGVVHPAQDEPERKRKTRKVGKRGRSG